MRRIENLRFDRAEIIFDGERVFVEVNPPEINMSVAAFYIT